MANFDERMKKIDALVRERDYKLKKAEQEEADRRRDYLNRFAAMSDRIKNVLALANHLSENKIKCKYFGIPYGDDAKIVRNNIGYIAIGAGNHLAVNKDGMIYQWGEICSAKLGAIVTLSTQCYYCSCSLEKLYNAVIKLESDFYRWIDNGCKEGD